MMQQYQSNSYLFGGNAPYVEEMYEAYLNNPGSVPDNWRDYFDAMQHVPAVDGSDKPDVAHAPVVASFAERAKQGPIRTVTASTDAEMGRKRVAATQLIAAYRYLGSRWANLDPLQRQERPQHPRTGAKLLRLHRCRHGHRVQHQQYLSSAPRPHRCATCSMPCATPTAAPSAPSSCTSPTRREKRWLQEKPGIDPRDPELLRGKEEAHPRPPDRGRRPGALPAYQVRRPEALLARRRRELHRLDGRD